MKYVDVFPRGGFRYDTDWCHDLRGRIDLGETFSNVWVTCYLKFRDLAGEVDL